MAAFSHRRARCRGGCLIMGATLRRNVRAVVASDIRRIGGFVSVRAGRDRFDGEPVFHVGHVSRGGDCCWQSTAIRSEDHAHAAARLLAEYVGGEVRIANP